MELKIKVPSLIWWILGIVSMGGLIISSFLLPNYIYYAADALNIILFLYAVRKMGYVKRIKGISVIGVLLLIFLLDTVIGVVGNGVPMGLAFWGVRNVYRYIIFMYSCIFFLNNQGLDSFLRLLPKIYYLNFAITMFQFIVQGKRGDYLGGVFGIAPGCNGATTIFLNIFIAIEISMYLYNKISFKKIAMFSIMYFVVAALSETKGNFLFFVAIVIMALMISRKSFKTVSFGIAALFALVVGVNILNIYFPGSADFLFDFDKANLYMDATYFGTTTFTRNAVLQVTNKVFFQDNIWLYCFGYGMGACDMSTYFASPFYLRYGYMNYRQYSSAMTVLQLGYIGLIVYIAFFIVTAIVAIRNSSDDMNEEYKFLNTAVACIAMFAIADSFYASLYIDMGYWIFFVMTIPWIIRKQNINKGVLRV